MIVGKLLKLIARTPLDDAATILVLNAVIKHASNSLSAEDLDAAIAKLSKASEAKKSTCSHQPFGVSALAQGKVAPVAGAVASVVIDVVAEDAVEAVADKVEDVAKGALAKLKSKVNK